MFSNMLETLRYNQLIAYIDLDNILYDKQFSSHKIHSPQIVRTLLTDKITLALDRGKCFIGASFLDFSEAFDTINDQILTRMLHYGI